MPSPRKMAVEFHTIPLLAGGWMWVREVRYDDSFALYVRSEMISSSLQVNPFTTKPK